MLFDQFHALQITNKVEGCNYGFIDSSLSFKQAAATRDGYYSKVLLFISFFCTIMDNVQSNMDVSGIKLLLFLRNLHIILHKNKYTVSA